MDYRQLDGTSTTAATDNPMTDNIISFPKKHRSELVPDPVLQIKGDRFELWSGVFFGMRFLLYGNGSTQPPQPPMPTGGAPAANRIYEQGRIAA